MYCSYFVLLFLEYTNYNLEELCTPIDAERLEYLLKLTRYNTQETQFLANGFRNGFSLEYRGPMMRQDTSDKISFTVGDKFILWNKLMKEVKLGRVAGPFTHSPFKDYIQSPIGLVAKGEGDTTLIFHLSYQFKNGNPLVNECMPKEHCTVKYNDLDHAISNTLKISQNGQRTVIYAKTDLKSAFRAAPLARDQYWLVLMKATHPVNGKTFLFIEKNLPFGHSVSCSHFQRFSNCLKYIMEQITGETQNLTTYLDDYLFSHVTENLCNQLVRTFLLVCKEINFPVANKKSGIRR